MNELKKHLHKLHLVTWPAYFSLVFILLLALGYPILIKLLGTNLIVNNYVYGLGIKIIDEALLFSYITIGVGIFITLLYQSVAIKKLERSLEQIFDNFRGDLSSIQDFIGEGKNTCDKTKLMMRSYLESNENNGLFYREQQESTKSKIVQISKISHSIIEKLNENQEFCKKITELFDDFEKNCKPHATAEEQMESVHRKIDQIQENIFKVQLLAFNVTIEYLKGQKNNCELPSTTNELERIATANSILLKDIQDTLDSYSALQNESCSAQIAKVIDVGQFVAKLLFNSNKLSTISGQISNVFNSEEFETSTLKMIDYFQNYRQEHQQLAEEIRNLQLKLDSINQIQTRSYDAIRLGEKFPLKRVGTFNDIPRDKINLKSNNAVKANDSDEIPMKVVDVHGVAVQIQDNEEIIKQNIASLYGCSPQKVKELFFL